MPFTPPPTAVAGSVVQAQHRNILRDNDNWFNALVPAPSTDHLVPVLTSPTLAVQQKIPEISFQDAAVTGAKLANAAISALKIADASLDATTLAASVVAKLMVAGLVLMVRTASSIPPGWTRETGLNGRFLIHAGTTFAVTYTEATDYGSSWSHAHTFTLISGTSSGTQSQLEGSGTATEAATAHDHGYNGPTAATSWIMPSIGYVFMRKS